MEQFKKILVAYDFSACSKKAVLEAAFLARKLSADIYVMHVLDADISEIFAAPLTQDWHDKVLKDVRDEIKGYEKDYDTPIAVKDAIVQIGSPYKAIIRKSLELDADLIVLGSHGRTAVGYALLGSVADKVARFSRVPVMICRTDRTASMSKVLVPLDDSEESERVLPYAEKFAGLYGSGIQLMQAVDVHEYYYVEYKHVFTRQKEKALARLKAFNEKHGINTPPLVVEGSASHAIIRAVQEDKAIGLVALMTHGRKGLKHFFLGRTTEAVCRYAECHVLTVPTAEHAKKIQDIKEHFDEKTVTVGNILI